MAEKKYTLEEAQQQLARRVCSQNGHDYVIEPSTVDPSEPGGLTCERCKTRWSVTEET